MLSSHFQPGRLRQLPLGTVERTTPGSWIAEIGTVGKDHVAARYACCWSSSPSDGSMCMSGQLVFRDSQVTTAAKIDPTLQEDINTQSSVLHVEGTVAGVTDGNIEISVWLHAIHRFLQLEFHHLCWWSQMSQGPYSGPSQPLWQRSKGARRIHKYPPDQA